MEKFFPQYVQQLFPEGGIIAFTSFGHGMGRSFIKRLVGDILEKELKGRIVSFSTGDVFRELALEKGFSDVGEFSRYLNKHPEEAVRVDTELDTKVRRLLREHVSKRKIVLLDSNLHALPCALRGLPHITFVIYARPEVVGKRLVENTRKGENTYTNPKEAVNAQLTRALHDTVRYAALSLRVEDTELKNLYREGSRAMAKLLRMYTIFSHIPPEKKLSKIMLCGEPVFVVDNSGDASLTLLGVCKGFLELIRKRE